MPTGGLGIEGLSEVELVVTKDSQSYPSLQHPTGLSIQANRIQSSIAFKETVNEQPSNNVHFVKDMRRDPKQMYKQPVQVDLDDDLRGRVERFAIVKVGHDVNGRHNNSPKHKEGSNSKDR